MNIYVKADSNWGISYKDKPLCSIPAEEKTRMQEIAGKVIVYGEKYIQNLPGQQPVRECMNIVFTDNAKSSLKPASNVKIFDTLLKIREELLKYDSEDIFIINNEKLYAEFLPDTDVVHVTKIDYSYKADAFFENLDKNPDFVITADSDEMYCYDIVYSFLKYERR